MKPVYVEGELTLPFSPDELWPYVSDTDRFDKSVGLPAAAFKRGDAGTDEPDTGEYRLLGRLPLARWIEHPFEWEKPRRFAVQRDYFSGPIRRFYGGAELAHVEGGTRLRVFAEFEPRSLLLVPLVRGVVARQSVQRSLQQYQLIADFLARRRATPFPRLVAARTAANSAQLETALARLAEQGGAAEAVALLRELLAEAPDEDVAGLRPLQLAADRGLDGQRLLEACLRATVVGLLEMRWELLCPGCHGVKADAAHLNELHGQTRCGACNLDFDPAFDELIEARFYPAPSIRDVEVQAYCVSGPARTQFRLLQALLAPGETRDFTPDLPPGGCILRSPQTRGLSRLTVEPSSGEDSLEARFESLLCLPEAAAVRAGRLRLSLVNQTSRRLTVTLDVAHQSREAATPARLMAVPAFQALFSAEALAPGIELQVRRIGLLFTDLAGSTALYERAGEARAFRLVTDHFAVLRTAIEEAGGAVVKTIGDAVMAAFPDGRPAVQAALNIQRAMAGFDARGLAEPARLVKVGVHAGACFAVTQNNRLDYFGTAVNIAARAQHEAHGGEIVLTQDAFGDSGGLLSALEPQLERFRVELKGIREPVALVRVLPNA